MPSAQLSCFDTTTGWWAECLGVGFVVGRRLIEGGAVPCLSPVLTDFPEISRKFEGLRLELVSRNFALVQQKSAPGPINHSWPPEAGACSGVVCIDLTRTHARPEIGFPKRQEKHSSPFSPQCSRAGTAREPNEKKGAAKKSVSGLSVCPRRTRMACARAV